MATFIANTIAKPVLAVVEVVGRIARDKDLSLQVPVTSKDEFGQMSIRLNEMISELKASFTAVTEVAHQVAIGAEEVSKRAGANKSRAEQEVEQTTVGRQVVGT